LGTCETHRPGRPRRLIIALPCEDFDRLQRLAAAEDQALDQLARYLLRLALRGAKGVVEALDGAA
jgi:hypothetical protein